jgi:hypothetical protein
MSAYHQLGHNSANLMSDASIGSYGGAILSPINYDRDETAELVDQFFLSKFDMVFDPQLYFPRAGNQTLHEWDYLPHDFDTADLTQDSWWDSLVARLAETVMWLRVDSVCSPVLVPRKFDNDFYSHTMAVAEGFKRSIVQADIDVLPTVLVHMPELTDRSRPFEIASIVTQSDAKRAYLLLLGGNAPKRELLDADEITGAMVLIALLQMNGIQTIVGYTSSDLLLWKYAHAASCATGKYFNLRKFTPARWEPSAGGRGSAPYWFAEPLMTYLQQADVLQLASVDGGQLVSTTSADPLLSDVIQRSRGGQSWSGVSWRQYMGWYASLEGRMDRDPGEGARVLRGAAQNWLRLKSLGLSPSDSTNDGRWITAWVKAIDEFDKYHIF